VDANPTRSRAASSTPGRRRGPAPAGSRRPWTRAALLATIPLFPVAAGAAPAAQPAAPAAPAAAPSSAADAARLAAQTAQQLTVIDEEVHEAQIQVADEQKTAADTHARAAAAQAAVDAYGPQLRAIAQAGLTDGGHSRVAAFLTSGSATDLVQQMTTLDMIASHTESVIAQVGIAQQAAQKAKADADAAAAKAQASLAALQQQEKTLQDQVASYKTTYGRLSAGERAAVTAAVSGPTLTASTSQAVAAAPSEQIATVIKTALAQQGKPYVYGASGPDGFDCSGLTSYAYAAIGVALPHSSKAQSQMGVQISRQDLQPGDIVYFYTPVSHVAIYIGNGMMVEARTFGQPVSVTSVDRSGYRGAVRILH
jgi:cell wall-associated NlpC family hydrolase